MERRREAEFDSTKIGEGAAGIRIAPHHAAQWGQAMLAELGEVKGEWAALFWAVGGSSVLVKHALVAMIFPGRYVPALLPSGGLFAKEGVMRKASLGIIGACVIAFLLFLLAPTFRQGLEISLAQWNTMSQVNANWPPPTGTAIRALEKQAAEKRDSEALAFVAVRVWDRAESTRLADEAVQLDPKLTWIYGAANATPEASERWIEKLKKCDPQNALPYFMEAENIDIAQVMEGKIPHNVDEESAAWKTTMASAFRSSKLDAYSDRLLELDRKIANRYSLRDPFQTALRDCFPCLPSYTAGNSSSYAKLELKSAELLEARGDVRGALAIYWGLIRFGEMTKRMLVSYVFLKDAYQGVAAIARKRGEQEQAALYSYLADEMIRERDAQVEEWKQTLPSYAILDWNANVMKVAGLLLPICGAILLICALTVLCKSRSLRLSSLCAGRGIVGLGIGSAFGMVLSSMLLYVSYWPFAELFRGFLNTGNEGNLEEFTSFLGYTQLPLGLKYFGSVDILKKR